MTAVVQFIVLKREDKWVFKSKDLERVFAVQREAADAASQASCSSKNRKPSFRKFGSVRASTRRSNLSTMSGTPKRRKSAHLGDMRAIVGRSDSDAGGRE